MVESEWERQTRAITPFHSGDRPKGYTRVHIIIYMFYVRIVVYSMIEYTLHRTVANSTNIA